MTRVQEPIEFPASPPSDDLDAHVQRTGEAAQDVQRCATNAAQLDIRNHGLRNAGARSQIHLTPTAAQPERSERQPDARVVHAQKR